MNYESLFIEIAKLAGLHFRHDIPIEYSDERRHGFLVAVDTGVLFEGSRIAEAGSMTSQRMSETERLPGKEQKLFYPVDKSITDLLGDYFPRERKIIIYKKTCESTSDLLGFRYDVLEYVVASHEISHAVTHLGEERFPGSGIIWESYPHADLWDKELFAQMYPLFHFGQAGKQEALDVFQKLSDNQLPIYNSWQFYRHTSLREINEFLSITRLKLLCAWIDLDPRESQSEDSPQS